MSPIPMRSPSPVWTITRPYRGCLTVDQLDANAMGSGVKKAGLHAVDPGSDVVSDEPLTFLCGDEVRAQDIQPLSRSLTSTVAMNRRPCPPYRARTTTGVRVSGRPSRERLTAMKAVVHRQASQHLQPRALMALPAIGATNVGSDRVTGGWSAGATNAAAQMTRTLRSARVTVCTREIYGIRLCGALSLRDLTPFIVGHLHPM